MNTNAADVVWVNQPAAATPPAPGSPWLATLADIASQWGWLIAAIVVGILVSAAFGDHRSRKGR